MSFALQIENLEKTYENGVKALKGINLNIKKGEFFALLGANGAGKTTLIGITTDLVNKTGGKVKIFGTDIDEDFSKAKKMVGVVPQEFNFNMFEKVIDIVIQQAGYYGIDRQTALKDANQILDDLGLGDKKQEIARNLSGGMKRRLMVARALINKPQLLILDEPTAGVDVELRAGMWKYLEKLNKEDGITILLTTHYLEEVEQLCEKAAIIKEGVIIKEDTVKNLLKSLDKEIYVIDIAEYSDLEARLAKIDDSSEVKFVIKDNTTLEAVVKKETSMNTLISYLDNQKIVVNTIRPKGNRLEELFLQILAE
jgi:ABC-2 type transport system ATP-binding protein